PSLDVPSYPTRRSSDLMHSCLRRRLATDLARAADEEDGLRRIDESAARVGGLLDRLTESSAQENGIGVNREPTDLDYLARRVAADRKNTRLNYSHVYNS